MRESRIVCLYLGGFIYLEANAKKMINLVIMLVFLATALSPVAAARPERSLFSREEMVNMAGYGEEKLSTVIVTGTVLCQAPSSHALAHPHHAWPIPGASVGIKCHTRNMMRGKSSWTHGVTDDDGDFIVDLPSHLHATSNLDRVCTVKVFRVPKTSLCRPAYVGKHSGIKLLSAGNGVRTYSTGTIKFLHSEPKPSQEIIKRTGNREV